VEQDFGRFSMRFIKRAFMGMVISALVVSMAVPAGAGTKGKPRARDPYSCGGKWTSGGVCNFKYAGGQLQIGGNFTADQVGFITVTLEALDSQTGQRVPLMSCGSISSSFGACGSFATDSPTIELEKGQQLFCMVQGADSGTYRCKSTRN
jgi:hypothetical protein